jgi:hypothetical protein
MDERCGREDVSAVQVTFDSQDPLESVIEVIKAIYGVEIHVEEPTGRMRHD